MTGLSLVCPPNPSSAFLPPSLCPERRPLALLQQAPGPLAARLCSDHGKQCQIRRGRETAGSVCSSGSLPAMSPRAGCIPLPHSSSFPLSLSVPPPPCLSLHLSDDCSLFSSLQSSGWQSDPSQPHMGSVVIIKLSSKYLD